MYIDNLRVLLEEQKSVIINSLDSLATVAREVVQQKNRKIYQLGGENSGLRERLGALGKGVLRIVSVLEELRGLRKNNKLLRVLLKKELNMENLRKNIRELRRESEEGGRISGKDMTAFKIIALELEEKEKTLRDSRTLLDSLENDKKDLMAEKRALETQNSSLVTDLEALRKRNGDLETISMAQLATIEALTREIQSKNEKVLELKEYFIQLLDNYNDILQKID
ncbi:MAG: hypothetical protein LBU15_03865 [Rickettsiales bacterium]|jgi:chromosome segregation ATPase|nr:hypothetical protein [Rickettsiales bacterium]